MRRVADSCRHDLRDRGCLFPGCGVRSGQGHHLRHWAQGGPTTLSNLALLCRRHHRAVHEEGYGIDRLPDGSLRFRRPDGRPLADVPPPAAVPADPVQVLHARTACPGWLGERLDVGWVINVLHPLATVHALATSLQGSSRRGAGTAPSRFGVGGRA